MKPQNMLMDNITDTTPNTHNLTCNSRRPLRTLLFISILSFIAVQRLFSATATVVFTENPNNTLAEAVTIGGTTTTVTWPLGGPGQVWNQDGSFGSDLGSEIGGNGVFIQWQEPGDPTEVNFTGFETIVSDNPVIAGNPLLPYGATALFSVYNTFIVGPGGSPVSADISFVDNGDPVQPVPDGGSTVMLLGTALCGIALLKKKVTR